MPLQIREAGKACLLALEPPGNLARDLALYRRSLFASYGAERGDASALAFPELAALAFVGPGAEKGFPRRAALAAAIAGCWSGAEGTFASSDLFVEGESLFLGIEGPWEALRQAAIEACAALDLEAVGGAALPFPPATGFFLCRAPGSALGDLPRPPRLSFRDCSLVALILRYGADPLEAATWKEIARSRRRTGPSDSPSQRRRR